jgi:hypothetical protein
LLSAEPMCNSFVLLSCLTLVACAAEPSSEPHLVIPTTTAPTFTLFVSNQSFDKPSLFIAIEIDGHPAIYGGFDVGSQHSWYRFDMRLDAGKHAISVEGIDTAATLDQDFVLGSRSWGVLDFWYSAPGSSEPSPEKFDFAVLDHEPAFD